MLKIKCNKCGKFVDVSVNNVNLKSRKLEKGIIKCSKCIENWDKEFEDELGFDYEDIFLRLSKDDVASLLLRCFGLDEDEVGAIVKVKIKVKDGAILIERIDK